MPITTAEVYAGLRYAEGFRWPGGSLTYSIPTATSIWSGASYGPGDEPFDADYGGLSALQVIAFIDAIGAWEAVINLDLFEIPENGSTVGQIRIAFTDVQRQGSGENTAAYAYTPPQPGFGTSPANGDIWIDSSYKGVGADPGSFLYETFLHEIGHTLGLKHPFEGAPLPAEFNNTRFTVMSYEDFLDSGLRVFRLEGNSLVASTVTVLPSTPMPLDIIAAQGIYGVSNSAQLGANTYTFDQASAFLKTIVDNGGADTFDLSLHSRASLVDLTPGAFSSIAIFSIQAQIAAQVAAFPNFSTSFISDFINRPSTYTWSNNLATSLETVIENVRAGSGSDTVFGNVGANSITGGAGSDSITGATGNDTIDGGSAGAAGNYLRGDEGDDSLIGAANFDDINGNMGNDTVATGAGDDFCVGGKDNDVLFGGAGGDFTYGNLGDDSCNGEDGNDIIRGGQGTDTLAGGNGDDFVSGDRGDDTMTGGAGADLFHSSMDAGIDRVLDFNLAQGDRVLLDPGTQFTVMQVGGDTVVMMSAGQVVLVGIQMSTLTPGTIFGA